MLRTLRGIVVLTMVGACSTPPPAKGGQRMTIQEVGGASVKLVPAAGQLPYCLVFTVSDRGIVRQLTMNRERQAMACEAGKPVGGLTFLIPVDEGAVRMHTIFSDRKLDADPIAQQVHDLAGQNPGFSAMDLRAPGTVTIETLTYQPSLEAEGVTVVGSRVAPAGSAPAAP